MWEEDGVNVASFQHGGVEGGKRQKNQKIRCVGLQLVYELHDFLMETVLSQPFHISLPLPSSPSTSLTSVSQFYCLLAISLLCWSYIALYFARCCHHQQSGQV